MIVLHRLQPGQDNLCDVTSSSLAGNIAVTGNGLWTVAPPGPTFVDDMSPTTMVNNLNPGANVFTWTISTGGGFCSSSDDVTLTRDATPTAAAAGGDQMICNVNNTALMGNMADNNGTGQWVITTGLIWIETFDSLDFGDRVDAGPTAWTVDSAGINLAGRPGHMRVEFDPTNSGKLFEVNNSGNPGVRWITETIDISSAPGDIEFSVDISSQGTGGGDWIEGFYTLDGSIPTPASTVLFAREDPIGGAPSPQRLL